MEILNRKDFSRGWFPSADAVNAPKNALLRADNLVLDDQGVLSLRKGSSLLQTYAGAPIVHSLYSVKLNGTRHRMAGAGDKVYSGNLDLGVTMAGSGDTAFGSHMGQILFARGSSKYKYDGSTVRNWGISKTQAVPAISPIEQDGKVISSCDAADLANWTYIQGQTVTSAEGHDGTAGKAIQVTPGSGYGGGNVRRNFSPPLDLSVYDSGDTGVDTDLIDFWLYLNKTDSLAQLTISIVMGESSYSVTIYPADPNAAYIGHSWYDNIPLFNTDMSSYERDATLALVNAVGNNQRIKLSTIAGWNHVRIPRWMFQKGRWDPVGSWSQVTAINVAYQTNDVTSSRYFCLESFRVLGGSKSPLTGKVCYRVLPVYNNGKYVAFSECSGASAEAELSAQATHLTYNPTGLDPQVNELWFFRIGGFLQDYYRVKVISAPFDAQVEFSDYVSDKEALAENVRLDLGYTVPPDDIIDIVGPYKFRIFACTKTHLYPSKRNCPDAFHVGQSIKVADDTEEVFWVRKALGGLYIGTSKDIYRLDGDGDENADGTITFTLDNMNIGNPPISRAVAQEGNALVYEASDGWRIFTGAASEPLSLDTDLLYKGQARHGVNEIDLAGRCRAVIGKSVLTAITPEAGYPSGSPVLYKYNFKRPGWYRHIYSPLFYSLYAEEDGTILAGDSVGRLWQLEVGTQDNGADIPVTLWTPVDDDNWPCNRKDAQDFQARLDTGGTSASIAIHLDGSGSLATTLSAAKSGPGIYQSPVNTLAPFRQVQLRVTGSFSTFKWFEHTLIYNKRPEIICFLEQRPLVQNPRRTRFGALSLTIDTIGADTTVIPVLDGVDQTAFVVNTQKPITVNKMLDSPLVGRDLWVKLSCVTGFEFYGFQPVVIETLPDMLTYMDLVPKIRSATQSRFGGFVITMDTFGENATIIPVIDGAEQTPFTVNANGPLTTNMPLGESVIGRDLWLIISCPTGFEFYDFQPVVLEKLPPALKTWEPPNLFLGRELITIREINLKAYTSTSTPIEVEVYFEDTVKATSTLTYTFNKVDVRGAKFGRGVHGLTPRIVFSSTDEFLPYWVEIIYRTSGGITAKKTVRYN